MLRYREFSASGGRPDVHMTERKKNVESLKEPDKIRCGHGGLHNIPLIIFKENIIKLRQVVLNLSSTISCRKMYVHGYVFVLRLVTNGLLP